MINARSLAQYKHAAQASEFCFHDKRDSGTGSKSSSAKEYSQWAAGRCSFACSATMLLASMFLIGRAADAGFLTQVKSAEETSTRTEDYAADDGKPDKYLSLDVATRRSRISGQPILVVFQAPWCASCKALTQELQSSEVQTISSEWNLVSIDVDRGGDVAEKFQVDAVPTLILLNPAGTVVARQTGFLTAGALLKWLKAGKKLAIPEPPVVLAGVEPPTRTESQELIELMGSANPEVREIAIARMASFPEQTRTRAIDALANVGLASRIGLIDLLDRWQAPLDGIDPWEVSSLTEERMNRLQEWGSTPAAKLGEMLETITPEQLVEATSELDRYSSDPTDATKLLPRFSRYGKHLLPAVYQRLGQTELDATRQRLLALRYWLVAGNPLRLSWSSGFVQLGAIDLDERRAAVREVLNRVTSSDADLLLELFGDSDPLIRELSLQGLQKVGARQTDEALIRLLSDPDLNVRAAVLKLLAEQKPKRMIPHVAAYLERETDSELIVHGLRFFRETADETQQLPVLIKLADNESWQVRAMVAEVLGQMTSRGSAQLRVVVADTLMKLVDDEDPFVVTRSVENMPAPKTMASMDRLAAIVDRRPELAEKVTAAMAKNDMDYDRFDRGNSVSPRQHFLNFVNDERPSVRVAGITGLAAVQIDRIDFVKTLADPAVEVRIAAAKAIMQRLDEVRNSEEDVSGFVASSRYSSSGLEARPSLLGSFFQGLFGGRKNDVPRAFELDIDDLPEPAEDEDTEEAAEVTASDDAATDFEEMKPLSEEARIGKLPNEATEEWIGDWTSLTEKRPAWIRDSLPLVEAMADSTDAEEQLPAVLIMVAATGGQEWIDRLFELSQESAEGYVAMAGILKWLPFEQRTALFLRMMEMPKHDNLKNGVLMEYAQVRSLAAAEMLWELAGNASLNSQALYQAIHQAYFGSDVSSYYVDDSDDKINSQLLKEVTERMTTRIDDPQSNSGTRQIALTLIYWMNRKTASEIADVWLKSNADPDMTNIALQIRLESAGREKLGDVAVPLLKLANDAGKKTVLQALVDGRKSSVFRSIESADGSLRIPINSSTMFYSGSGNEPKLRAPAAPNGMEFSDIESLLASDDPEARALATYFSILLDNAQPITPLVDYWSRNKGHQTLSQMVVDVIALRGDDQLVPLIVEIYELHGGLGDTDFSSRLYWTIRSMTGPAAMALRQRIRRDVGMDRLN